MPPRNAHLSGHAPAAQIGLFKTLTKIAETYEERARVVRATITVLAEARTATKQGTARGMFAEAVARDAARRSHTKRPTARPHTKKPHRAGYGSKANQLARRKATEAMLAQFDPTTPRDLSGLGRIGYGPLIHHGYIKRKGKGYIRTAKEFTA